MVQRKKLKMADDAEVSVPESSETKNEKDLNKKTEQKIKPNANFRHKFLRPTNIIILLQSVVMLAACFGLFIYSETKDLEILADVNEQISSIKPEFTLDDIQKKLVQLENRSINTNKKYVDSVKIELEKNISSKIDNLGENHIRREKIVFLENNLSILETNVSKISLAVQAISEQTSATTGMDPVVMNEYKDQLFEIEKRVTRQITKINDALDVLQKEFEVLKHNNNTIDFTGKNKLLPSYGQEVKAFNALQKSFSELSYKALKRELIRNAEDNFFSYIIATIRSVFVLKSTTPKSGFSTDDILSRAEYQLKLGNLKSCLEELEYLDAESKEIFSDWINELNSLTKM